MIERLTGTCRLKHGTQLILDVGGVGYGVEMTEGGLARVGQDQDAKVEVWIHTHVKEDQLKLFGFPTHGERLLFKELLDVNDVGPKVAMAIMGTLSIRQLLDAVATDDPASLETVPGIGPKKSKLILLMLKNKLPRLETLGLLGEGDVRRAGAAAAPATPGAAPERLAPELVADLRSALTNFGYKEKELQPLLRRFERAAPAADLAGLIRAALAELTGKLKAEEELF
jgi:Holliday junction DNA helicase RuvA